MKTTIFTRAFLAFLFLGMFAQADELEMKESHFSVRVRPMALAYGILGAEVYYNTDDGYYAGLSAQFGSEDDSDKESILTNNEYGIKFGKFFGKSAKLESGWWAQGAVNLNHTSMTSVSFRTQQTLGAAFQEISAGVTAGYQFRMTFFDPERLNMRLGAGIGYIPPESARVEASDGSHVTLSLRRRLDPILEFTFGYLL